MRTWPKHNPLRYQLVARINGILSSRKLQSVILTWYTANDAFCTGRRPRTRIITPKACYLFSSLLPPPKVCFSFRSLLPLPEPAIARSSPHDPCPYSLPTRHGLDCLESTNKRWTTNSRDCSAWHNNREESRPEVWLTRLWPASKTCCTHLDSNSTTRTDGARLHDTYTVVPWWYDRELTLIVKS